jgi:hypothetical protein
MLPTKDKKQAQAAFAPLFVVRELRPIFYQGR